MILMTETDDNLKLENETVPAPKKKHTGRTVLLVFLMLVLTAGAAFWFLIFSPYLSAGKLMESGDYAKAAEYLEKGLLNSELLDKIGGFQDSAAMLDESLMHVAADELKNGNYEQAASTVGRISDSSLIKEAVYQGYEARMEAGDFDGVKTILHQFGAYTDPLSRYEAPAEKQMELLIENGENEKALALCAGIDKLDAAGILSRYAAAKMAKLLESGDIDGARGLLADFGSLAGESLAVPVGKAVSALLDAGSPEQALDLVNALSSEELAFASDKYRIAYAMMLNGDYEAAVPIYESLGDYSESETFLREAKYRAMIAEINTIGTLSPEDYVRFWQVLQELDGIEKIEETRKNFVKTWVDSALFSDTPYDYAVTVKDVEFSEEDKAEYFRYVLEKTPALVTVDSNNFTHYHRTDGLKAILILVEKFTVESDSAEAAAFTHYVNYLITRSVKDMPSVDDLRVIWDVREDLTQFCFNDEPLVAFLTGSWVDRNGKEQLRVIKNAKGEVSFSYNLPMVAKGNAFQVSFGGLNVMISKLDSARVCWITIENCDTISLRNAANNATYKLTRVTK